MVSTRKKVPKGSDVWKHRNQEIERDLTKKESETLLAIYDRVEKIFFDDKDISYNEARRHLRNVKKLRKKCRSETNIRRCEKLFARLRHILKILESARNFTMFQYSVNTNSSFESSGSFSTPNSTLKSHNSLLTPVISNLSDLTERMKICTPSANSQNTREDNFQASMHTSPSSVSHLAGEKENVPNVTDVIDSEIDSSPETYCELIENEHSEPIASKYKSKWDKVQNESLQNFEINSQDMEIDNNGTCDNNIMDISSTDIQKLNKNKSVSKEKNNARGKHNLKSNMKVASQRNKPNVEENTFGSSAENDNFIEPKSQSRIRGKKKIQQTKVQNESPENFEINSQLPIDREIGNNNTCDTDSLDILSIDVRKLSENKSKRKNNKGRKRKIEQNIESKNNSKSEENTSGHNRGNLKRKRISNNLKYSSKSNAEKDEPQWGRENKIDANYFEIDSQIEENVDIHIAEEKKNMQSIKELRTSNRQKENEDIRIIQGKAQNIDFVSGDSFIFENNRFPNNLSILLNESNNTTYIQAQDEKIVESPPNRPSTEEEIDFPMEIDNVGNANNSSYTTMETFSEKKNDASKIFCNSVNVNSFSKMNTDYEREKNNQKIHSQNALLLNENKPQCKTPVMSFYKKVPLTRLHNSIHSQTNSAATQELVTTNFGSTNNHKLDYQTPTDMQIDDDNDDNHSHILLSQPDLIRYQRMQDQNQNKKHEPISNSQPATISVTPNEEHVFKLPQPLKRPRCRCPHSPDTPPIRTVKMSPLKEFLNLKNLQTGSNQQHELSKNKSKWSNNQAFQNSEQPSAAKLCNEAPVSVSSNQKENAPQQGTNLQNNQEVHKTSQLQKTSTFRSPLKPNEKKLEKSNNQIKQSGIILQRGVLSDISNNQKRFASLRNITSDLGVPNQNQNIAHTLQLLTNKTSITLEKAQNLASVQNVTETFDLQLNETVLNKKGNTGQPGASSRKEMLNYNTNVGDISKTFQQDQTLPSFQTIARSFSIQPNTTQEIIETPQEGQGSVYSQNISCYSLIQANQTTGSLDMFNQKQCTPQAGPSSQEQILATKQEISKSTQEVKSFASFQLITNSSQMKGASNEKENAIQPRPNAQNHKISQQIPKTPQKVDSVATNQQLNQLESSQMEANKIVPSLEANKIIPNLEVKKQREYLAERMANFQAETQQSGTPKQHLESFTTFKKYLDSNNNKNSDSQNVVDEFGSPIKSQNQSQNNTPSQLTDSEIISQSRKDKKQNSRKKKLEQKVKSQNTYMESNYSNYFSMSTPQKDILDVSGKSGKQTTYNSPFSADISSVRSVFESNDTPDWNPHSLNSPCTSANTNMGKPAGETEERGNQWYINDKNLSTVTKILYFNRNFAEAVRNIKPSSGNKIPKPTDEKPLLPEPDYTEAIRKQFGLKSLSEPPDGGSMH